LVRDPNSLIEIGTIGASSVVLDSSNLLVNGKNDKVVLDASRIKKHHELMVYRSPDAETEPNWERSALVTIDMQNDFARPSGSAFISGTDSIVPALSRLAHAFRAMHRPIIHAIRLYEVDGNDAELCRRQIVRSSRDMVRPGSEGAQLVVPLLPSGTGTDTVFPKKGIMSRIGEAEWLMYKPRWSAFFRTDLEWRLNNLGVDTVVVAGCNFPNCPSATLFDASSRDLKTVLVTDATSGLTPKAAEWLSGIGAAAHTVDEVECNIIAESI
jgi:nicotinamidase-related amidase